MVTERNKIKKIIYIIILFITLIHPVSSYQWAWRNDTTIVSGLGNVGNESTPSVFINNSILYLISGNQSGCFIGYNWTGTTWQSDASIVSGLVCTSNLRSAPTIFTNNSILYLVTGNGVGSFSGYNWTGTTWQSDASIVSGLSSVGGDGISKPFVFTNNSILYLITGRGNGNFTGYNWTGTTWQSDASIVSGLSSAGNYSSPVIFINSSMLHLISGNLTGGFTGYSRVGNVWQSDVSIVSGLGSVGNKSAPTIFTNNSILYLVTGNGVGSFSGYNWTDIVPTVPTISFPVNNSRQWNNSINYTWNQSTDADNDTITYDFWLSNQSNFGYTSNRSTFSNNWTGNLISSIYYNGTESSMSSVLSYTKVYQFNITVPINNYSINFDIKGLDNYGKIYRNGGAFGTEQIGASDYTTKTQSFNISLQSGDTIELWVRTHITESTVYVKNFNLLTNITDSTTYYGKVRAYDTHQYSNWSNITQFTENTAPSVINITLSPSSPSVVDNLTISMNGTDNEGDPLTKYYLWYKNSVLQSWNGTFVNYSGNYTAGDLIYVVGYVSDGYENSTQLQSNTVSIGSGNAAPVFTTLTLIPSTKKNNQTININASGIIDDSTSWQLQTYYKSGGNVYIANSTWTNASFINITAVVPFTTGGAHTIYAVIYDSGNATNQSNLTSSEKYATFTSDMTNPTLVSSSLSASAITVGSSITISAQFNGQGANISSAIVRVLRPDATSAGWNMTCGSGEIVNCTRQYTSTSDVGEYDILYFYPTDTAGITAEILSSLTFTASNPSSGGGGGGTVIINPTPTQAPLKPSLNLSLIGITDGARNMSEVAAINECLTGSFFLDNECTGAIVVAMKEQVNWASLLVGCLFGAFGTVYISNIIQQKKRSIVLDSFIYTIITIIMLLSMNLIGFNFTYLFNYLLNSNIPAWLFLSSVMWAFLVTVILDATVMKNENMIWKIRKFNI